jgi:hypothetical protein
MKRITIEEGPLAGKEYDVPEDTTVLDIPVTGGHYTVGPKHAPWHADEAPKPRAPRAPKRAAEKVTVLDGELDGTPGALPEYDPANPGPHESHPAPTANTPE